MIGIIKQFGVNVDFIGFESRLVKYADDLIKRIPKSVLSIDLFQSPKKEVLILNHESGRIGLRESHSFMTRHTCAILSAVWSLARLGFYKLKEEDLKRFSDKPFTANKIITILPRKYKSVEDKVIKIIESAGLHKFRPKMKYKFY